MSTPRRTHAQARAEMREGILRLGKEQLAQTGAAGLSVREIARGLGVASSAIYRHLASRDELLTLLLVDAYTELANRVAANDDAGGPAAARLGRLTAAMRTWALTHPERWALIYGSPVPGYAAPAEATTAPGTRVMGAFLSILLTGGPHGAPSGTTDAAAPSDGTGATASETLDEVLRAGAREMGLADLRQAERGGDAVLAWTGLIGLISAEIFGHLGPDLARHGAELLERWVAHTAHDFGLPT